ncbi:LacI family DNA-binding transcriptional regulator [Loktanella sp. SALINAS62]|uniref:LacI family DNA-binding transcriptional regulator n=1 Tax=Loktanella sp. SALINAS62 TaxID=2706124 RepID=UPI001B8A9778|nr:LacI family DNA-binding transcriptional regulator [Loktanella sp. SALINAS62]MBS1302676.1 LacI family DNA-binding transcriptional regulator [Loktanella sp. SALINAS62]
MQDVGRMAGVSQVTVSRALSDPSKVSKATLDRIQAAIYATGFVPNAAAGALASRRSHLISALVPSITNIVYSSFIRAFSERIRADGYQILLSETGFDQQDEETAVKAHLSRQPDAILLTGIHHSRETRRMLLASGIPVVEVWDISDTPIDTCVGFDHAAAARTVAKFAIKNGYRTAATITAGDSRARQRQVSFAQHFQTAGGFPVMDIDIGGPASIAAGRTALTQILKATDVENSAAFVFCSSDLLAHGALIEAAKRGIVVPDALAIMGFGDQDFAASLEPPLTSLRVDRDLLGHSAAEALIARINGHPVKDVTRINFEIALRNTVLC